MRTLDWRLVAVGVATVLAGVATVYWCAVTNGLQREFGRWVDQQRERGHLISFSAITRAGFPLSPRIEIQAIGGRAAGVPPLWAWGAERAIVEAAPFAPESVVIRLKGDLDLAFEEVGTAAAFSGTAEMIYLGLRPGGWLPAGVLSVQRLSMTDAVSGDRLGVASLAAKGVGDPAVPTEPQGVSYRVEVTAEGVEVPKALALPFGHRVRSAALDLAIVGALAPIPWPEAVLSWRDGGGVVEIAWLEIVTDIVALTGSATLALDGAAQPMGAMSVRLVGVEAFLNGLVEARLLDRQTADQAKQAFRAITLLRGRGDEVEVPLTLQSQTLSLGPFPLLRVPTLQWPAEQRPLGSQWRPRASGP